MRTMNYRDQTKALNQTTIQAVGGLLGLKLPLSGMANCPFPDHDDGTPSFEVKKSGNRWRCYGCNRTGGAIDFIKIYRGTGFADAKRWLADATGMMLKTTPFLTARHSRITPNTIPPPDATRDLPEPPPDYEVYEALLRRSPLESSGQDYLLERGLSEQTISKYRIGQISDYSVTLRFLLKTFGYQRVERAGLLTKQSTAQNMTFIFPAGSLLFPFIEKHHTAYLQVRLISNSGSRKKWRNLNHRRHRVYNVDALNCSKNTRFAICEGAIDTLSAIELGYSAIGLLGVSARLEKKHIDFLRGKKVDVLFDWDLPGETRAKQLQEQLRRFGIASTRKHRPSCGVKDLNDYLRTTRTST